MSIKLLMHKNVEEFLQVKNWMTPNPTCIRLGQTFKEASEMIVKLRVDVLPVVDEKEKLVGMLTVRKLLSHFTQGNHGEALISSIPYRNFATVRPNESILHVYTLPHDQLVVVDDQEKAVGILTLRDMMDGISKFIHKLEQRENTADVLSVILESAYEGIAVVDEYGTLLEFNDAYSRFTGIERKDAIGRHVTEVIDNTNLHVTVKTGIPERGVIQNIQGQDMVVHRIPIWKEGKVAGAIGMLIFEGVTEVYKIYESLQKSHMAEHVVDRPLTLKLEEDSRMTLDQILGVSEEITDVKGVARRAARTAASVLITGESGTGKEMFAKSIHHLSPFAKGPFISVNCGAIPDALFESELFGYEEGAFTGAKKGGKPGKFELAHNGTLFLDEIGEMPLIMQTKLLRVLQEKEAERVGGVKKYQIEARIIAATNRNLKDMVKRGEFREDLYYRLDIIQLHIPALRERKKDIPILLSYYVKKVCETYHTPIKTFTAEAVSCFIQYEWKGNIRELVNTIERLVTLMDGSTIEIYHLPESMKIKDYGPTSERVLTIPNQPSFIQEAKKIGDEKEKELILQILKETGGNRAKAAKLLGIHRTTLYQKLKKYQIQ